MSGKIPVSLSKIPVTGGERKRWHPCHGGTLNFLGWQKWKEIWYSGRRVCVRICVPALESCWRAPGGLCILLRTLQRAQAGGRSVGTQGIEISQGEIPNTWAKLSWAEDTNTGYKTSGSSPVFCVLQLGSSAGHGSCSTSCRPLRYPRHGPASLTARHHSQRCANVQQISPATLGPHQLTFAWSKVLMRWQPAAIPALGCLEREAQPQEQQSRVSPVNAESEPFPASLVEICFAKKYPFLGSHLRQVVCNCCVAASSPSVCALGLSVQAAVPEHCPTSWAGVTLVGLVSPW